MSLIELIGVLFLLLAAPIAHAATVQAVARPCLERTITIKEAYRSVLPILAPLIGTMILLDVLLVIALFALVVPCIYFVTCWSLILPVMLVEGRFGINALSRSRALVVGSWWKTLGILVVAGLIGALPAAGLGFVWSFIPVASNLLNAVTQAVTYSFSSVALVLYYFERRCRVEQFDLHLLASQIRADGTAAVAAAGASGVG